MRAFQLHSPENRSNTDVMNSDSLKACLPTQAEKPVRAVPIVTRLRGTRFRLAVLIQEFPRLEVRRIVAVGRGDEVALLHIRQRVPLGMNIASYQSSSIVLCGMRATGEFPSPLLVCKADSERPQMLGDGRGPTTMSSSSCARV
jgi:hypothetical protein